MAERPRTSIGSLHPQNLAVFRVLLAVTLALDLAARPPEWLAGALAATLAAVVLLAFTLGFRTRLMHALLWLGVALPALLAGGGGTAALAQLPALELTVTWSLLLPLGARGSIDALRASLSAHRELSAEDLADRAQLTGPTAPVRSLWSFALWAQLLLTAALVASGTLSPTPTRLLLLCAGAALLLGPSLWPLQRWFAARGQLECFFDSGCGICFQLARLLARLDRLGRVELVSNRETARLPPGITARTVEDTIVVRARAGGAVYTRAAAIAVVCRALPFGFVVWALLSLPGLGWLWDALYDLVARNRVRISVALGFAACELPPPAQRQAGPDAGVQREASQG